MLKRILIAALWLPLIALAQTYPSPTFQNVTVRGTLTAPAPTFTTPLPVASGGTNCSAASGTCLDNITGFASTGFLTRTGAGAYAFQSLTNGITLGNIAQVGANSLLGNATGSTANVAAVSVAGCNGAAQALQWTNGSGFQCNSSIATSGANANITSLSGLTTPLSVSQGGSGLATRTAHAVQVGNGTGAITQVAPSTAGQALISAGASADPTWGYPTGTLIGIQIFTSSGTYTPDAGTNSVIVEAVGGGGGGGGVAATGAGQTAAAGGGAAGGYVRKRLTSGFSGATVTIGSAGSGGTAGANSGGAGGNTSFGASITAGGGVGGGGGTAFTPPGLGQNGAGGTATGGDINVAGAGGSIYYVASANTLWAGPGESSFYGRGGKSSINGAAANAASGFGSGGSGASNVASASAQAGASGTAGLVIVWEYN
jgi:hypothetical protein